MNPNFPELTSQLLYGWKLLRSIFEKAKSYNIEIGYVD